MKRAPDDHKGDVGRPPQWQRSIVTRLTSLDRFAGSGLPPSNPIAAGTSRLKAALSALVLILRTSPGSAPVQDVRLRPRCYVAPPKVIAFGSSRPAVSDISRFPGVVALLGACGLIRRNSCIVDPRNTSLPQCKIVRDKERTKKHQALSDRPKNYFRYSRAYLRAVSRLFG